MGIYTIGPRLHDYGRDSVYEMFRRMTADGFTTCQLAYTKAISGVNAYTDVTPEVVADTLAAMKQYNVTIGVLGCYVEVAINDEKVRRANVETVKSMIPVAKALHANCIGFETTDMRYQPAGTSRERGQYLLCKSLEEILPEAERQGVTIAIEPVYCHSMNTPEACRRILDTMQSPALGTIFDAGNVLTAEEVTCQDQLWDRVGNLYGDRIRAVHFKTQCFNEKGDPRACLLSENQIDWDSAFRMLNQLDQEIPVLREELKPVHAAIDVAEMRRLTGLK